MPFSFSVLTLLGAFTLSLFLGVLNFWFWRAQREDRTPLWMAVWLGASAAFTFCRLLQYTSLSKPLYILVPRILLSFAYPLAWLAYELGNSFINYHPPRWERALILSLVAVPIVFLWTGNLILTDQTVVRTVAFGGKFTGVQTGTLYLPFSILVLVLGAVPVVRLARTSSSQKRENRLMAAGLLFVILFSLSDFIATVLGLVWSRFSDFSYLPVAILFSYIQVRRFGRLYGEMNLMVHERTAELSQVNETLRTSEERYRKLIHTARDVIFTISVDGTFTSLNPSFEIFTGWSRAEWLGRSFDDLIVEEDRPHAHELFNRVLHAETLRAIRLHVYTCGKEVLVIELNLSPQIEDSQVIGLLGIARDMTEEQRAEDALRESEEKYRTVVESAKDGITIIQNGRVSYVNQRLAEMRGEEIDDILGQHFNIFVHPDERHKILERYRRRMTGKNEPTTYETVLLHKDNFKVYAELTTGLITYKGSPAEIVIVRDITERKRVETALRESEARYRALKEQSVEAIYMHDVETNYIIEANPAFLKLLGYTLEEACTLTLYDIVAHDRENIDMYARQAITEGVVNIGERQWRRKDGALVDVEVTVGKIRQGEKDIIFSVARDITKRKQVEASLTESEMRFRTLIEESPLAISLSRNGVGLYANPKFLQLFGLSSVEEAIGRTIADYFTHRFREESRERTRRQALGLPVPPEFEADAVRVDGSQFPVHVAVASVNLADGPASLAFVRDITERKQAQRALQDSEERYRTIFENSTIGMYRTTPDGEILLSNTALLRMLGYDSSEELVHRNLEQEGFAPGYTRSEFHQRIEGEGNVQGFESAWIRKDGSTIFVRESARIIRDTDGEVLYYEGTIEDITKRKQAEEAVKESEAQYRRLVEHSPYGIVVHVQGKVVYANPASVSLVGAKNVEEVLGKSVIDFVHPESRPIVIQRLKEMSEGKDVPPLQEKFICLDGHVIDVEVTAYPFVYQNEPAVQVVFYDITESKQAEEVRLQTVIRLQREADAVATVAVSENLAEGAIQELAVELTEVASGALGVERVNVWLFEGDETRLVNIDNFIASTRKHSSGAILLEREFQNEFAALKRAKYVDAHDPMHDPRTIGYVEGYLRPNRITSMLDGVIRFAGRNLGLLCLEHVDKPHHWENDEIAFVCQLADQIALAISNRERKQVEEEIRRRADEFAALYEITRDLAAQRDLSSLLETIVEHATTLLSASTGAIFLYNGTHNNLDIAVAKGFQRPDNTSLELGEGMAGRVAQTRQPLIVDNYSAWEHRSPKYEMIPMTASLQVPMLSGGNLIGVLDVSELQTTTHKFTETDVRLLTLFANQAAIAIENSRLLEVEQRRSKEADAIAAIGHDILSTLELDIVLKRIAVHAKDLLDTETSAVYLHEPSAIFLRAIVAIGPDAEEIKRDPIKIGEGILGRIAGQKTGEIVNESATDPRGITIAGTEDIPHEHLMGVPVLSEDKLTGLIAVWRTGEDLGFKQTELDFLSRLAGQVAVAIENARLFEAEQARRQEADTMREAARRITSTLDQEQAIQLILEQLAKAVPFESASMQLFRDGYLEIVGGQGWSDPSEVLGVRFSIPGDNPNTQVVLERHPVILGNAPQKYPNFNYPPHKPIISWLGVPLIVRDRVIGMFAVDHSQADFFTETDAQLISAFASQAAIAIENARLFEETEKRLREAEAIGQVGIVLNQTLELEPLLENILRTVIDAIPAAERGSTLLADEEGSLHIRAVWGYADPRVLGFTFSPDTGYAALCFREQRAITIPDVRADATIRYNGDIPEMLESGSAMAVPLIVKDQAIGVIAVDTTAQVKAFDDSDLYLLKTIAISTALAIENARLFENTRRRLAEIEAVHTVSTALRSAQTFEEALPIILDQLLKLLNAGSALVDLLDPSTGEIVTELAYGAWAPMTGLRTPGDAGGSGHVITTGQPYVSNDLLANGLIAHPNLLGGLNAAACVPVIAQHQPIGTLWIGRQAPVHEEEVSLLAAIGEMVGNAIHRMRLLKQTKTLLDDLQEANRELSKAYDTTLEGWAKALELRDKETEGHSRRVTDLTLKLARQMGISEAKLTHVHRGVLLHDIGKMGVPDQILKNTGPLGDDEWVEMRKHPQYAYDLIYPIAYLRPALDIPYCHHERWDGSGYPRGLKGEKIPLAARIFAVVDVWDALINDRPYRKAWTEEKTLDYIQEQSGIQFDPQVVNNFLAMLNHGAKSKN